MAEDEGQPTEGQPTEGEPTEAEAPQEQPAAEETVAEEQPAAEETATPAEAEPAAEEPAAEKPAAEEAPAAEEPAAAAEETPDTEERPRRERPSGEEAPSQPDVVPGAHLEPDLVLDQSAGDDDEFARYADPATEGEGEAAASVEEQAAPVPRSTIDLAADARYKATGKRKTAIARVVVKPGSGAYKINGRTLEEFFPRQTLQRNARLPLETVGYDTRMDVVARITGGGVSSQADALRHGISRALVEADPNLRTELKRRGFLTRDAREKERKKAGLKKARKRPQFSKR
jgi:small subunit ribosomal protein S9